MIPLYDSHTHTDNSLDAHYTMEAMAQAAVDKRLNGIAFTDHADIDYYEACQVAPRMKIALQQMEDTRSLFQGQVEVLVGMEIGQPLYNIPWAEALPHMGEYDFIIGSVHSVRSVGGFYDMNMAASSPRDIHDFLTAYFDEVMETVQKTHFDTLAHLTYPLRYIRQFVSFPVSYDPFEDKIRTLMALLVDRGWAL